MTHNHPFVRGYVEAALWLAYRKPLDTSDPSYDARGHGWTDLDAETQARILSDCRAFLSDPDVARILSVAEASAEQAGHDFFLSRNGHGVGFWDRPELYGGQQSADRLSALARSYGDFALVYDPEADTIACL